MVINTSLPRIEQLYFEAMKNAKKLKIRKIHDYNNGAVHREDYYLFGDLSLINELWKKVLRLVSIYSSGSNPECEKVEDTLLDIINYSADFWSLIKLREEQNERNIQRSKKSR